jgi:uncharacterized membrane protein
MHFVVTSPTPQKKQKKLHAAQKQVQRIATTPRSCVVQENTASEQAGQKRYNRAKTEQEQ